MEGKPYRLRTPFYSDQMLKMLNYFSHIVAHYHFVFPRQAFHVVSDPDGQIALMSIWKIDPNEKIPVWKKASKAGIRCSEDYVGEESLLELFCGMRLKLKNYFGNEVVSQFLAWLKSPEQRIVGEEAGAGSPYDIVKTSAVGVCLKEGYDSLDSWLVAHRPDNRKKAPPEFAQEYESWSKKIEDLTGREAESFWIGYERTWTVNEQLFSYFEMKEDEKHKLLFSNFG